MAIILTSAKFDWIDWDLSGGGLPMFIPIPFANTSNGWSGPNPWQSVPVAEKELEPFAADLHLPYHRSSTISFGIAMSTACQRKNLRGLVQWYSMVFHGIPWYSSMNHRQNQGTIIEPLLSVLGHLPLAWRPGEKSETIEAIFHAVSLLQGDRGDA